MENYEAYYMIAGGLNALGKLILVLASGILLTKQRNWGSIIMFLGSILSIVLSLIVLLGTTLSANYSLKLLATSSVIGNFLTTIPPIIFSIGLLLFVLLYVKKIQNNV